MTDQTSGTSSAPASGPAPTAPAQSPGETAESAAAPAPSGSSQVTSDAGPTDASASPTPSSPPAARPYAGPTSLRAARTLADFDALVEEALRRRAEKVKEVTNEARRQHDHRMAGLGGELVSLARQDGSDLATLVDEMVARLARGKKKPDPAFVDWQWRKSTQLSPGPSPWRRRTAAKDDGDC